MDKMTDRLTIEEHNGQRIACVDYRGLNENEMIELTNIHLEFSLNEKLPFLADYHGTYVTPEYMKHGRKFAELTKHIKNKGAFLGVSQVKSFILKGVVIFFGVNYRAFDSKEKAIEFLTNDKSDIKETSLE